MYDVAAIGEVLIDFTPGGKSANGNTVFEQNPGGAPANVLAALAKLGRKTAFIGKVGNDQFGNFLRDILVGGGIDTKGLVFSDTTNTTLAFVHLTDKGDRSFSFYRNPGADMMLSEKEVDMEIVEKAKIFHFGSVSMTSEPSRSATMIAVKHARDNGILVSYDPNLRPPLWGNLKEAKNVMLEGMKYCDILKISHEELEFLTGVNDLERGSKYLVDNYPVKLLFVTQGPEGCFYRIREGFGQSSTYDVPTIDTTGAGDGFLGGILYKLLEDGKRLDEYTLKDVEGMVDFANALGSLATIKKGAIPAMPALHEIEELVRSGKKLTK